MNRVAPWHQTNWDWRAAGNFNCGGTGTGVLVFAAVAHALGGSYRLPAIVGLALVAVGLFSVWLEIGRPFRALNVIRQPQLSWMSRESLVAPFLFACGIAAAWFDGGAFAWAAGVLAAAFLYCQARMLKASKGIPVWRNPRIVPLIMLTGLTEGLALVIVLAAFDGFAGGPRWLPGILIVLVVARGLAWRAYRAGVDRDGAPARALKALRSIDLPMALLATWGPLLCLIAAMALPAAVAIWVAAAGALSALAAGWLLKFTLITRAAYNQGFALPRLPVRGAGAGGAGVKPGWR